MRFRSPLYRVFLGLICLSLLACNTTPQWWEQERQWRVMHHTPPARLNALAVRNQQTGRLEGDNGYSLYIATSAVGISFQSADAFLETFHHHPRTSKSDHSLGHAWILLESPAELRESGHTGEFGVEMPTYYEDMVDKINRGDQNPISALWETKTDGKFHEGADRYTPTLVARLPISRDKYQRILEYIANYDYSRFSLIDRQCTDFVVGAAKLAGVELSNRVRIDLPQRVFYRGKTIQIWSDPQYRRLEIATPDILEEDVLKLISEHYADDATTWYLQDG